ncbi:VTT domain-containing protein [Aquirufa ecclesiirivi]|uniref:Cytochrome O ubiquinol oxidase n=1 Tax=Aquirufa ecclesiirivi TaxID=2715124 RepID=A0ABT4JIT9_9BACT|nr:VTT domain-containing protein [Aquirufa ecclesiirivi]MCZ2471786.1 cytochrome O ubiquinol oxidase [Aquirufa ecclesiirivi]MCZ2476197.1 cytochrome O ubiquinol oxidase [Aquirufa ecclesiirivi]NHC49406.1 cytochrome O ubiquinol oxidase [Aquirufa ecclesiirivi]
MIQQALDLLKDPLHFLTEFIAAHGSLTYALLFAIVFMETGLVVTPLLPGDSLLFSVGLIAAASGQLSIAIVIPMLILAALSGDQVNYFMGKYFSAYVRSKDKILFLKRSHFEETEKFYEKYGVKTVIIARFVPIVRTVAPFVAGAGRMSYSVYLLFGFLGACLWVTSITLAGYFLGDNEWVKSNFEKVVLGIVGVSVLPIIIGIIKQKFTAK